MLISRYQKRLSGPLLDRIDIHVEVPRVPFQKLSDEHRGEPSAAIRVHVEATRARQSARFNGAKDGQDASLTTNADMGPTQVRDHYPVDEAEQLFGAAMQRLRPGDELERGRIIGCSSWHARSRIWRGASASSRRISRRRSSIGHDGWSSTNSNARRRRRFRRTHVVPLDTGSLPM